MAIKTIGIVGYGAFGKLLHALINRFVPTVQVLLYSRSQIPDSITFFSLAQVCATDALVLAVPIHRFEEVLTSIISLLRTDTILVDVSTVKVHTLKVLKRLVPHQQYISTHPMWGPESYTKHNEDISGFRIVITDHTLAHDHYQKLTSFLGEIGFKILCMTADAHDRQLAETLFLTHYIGQIVAHGGFARTEIDTVSFGYLMDAVESVRHDAVLFRDVFRYNPYCQEVLNRFEREEKEVRALLTNPSH